MDWWVIGWAGKQVDRQVGRQSVGGEVDREADVCECAQMGG